jgi:hypothetical protein
MNKKIFTLFISLLVGNAAWASDKTFYLGTGSMLYNMNKVTSANDASTSIIGQFYIPLTLTMKLKAAGKTFLIPSITYTPLGVTASDSVTKKILSGNVNALMDFGAIEFKYGVGIMIYSISGTGGTVTRNNGGSTATFNLPGSSQSSKSILIDLGFGTEFGGDFRVDLDFLAVSALSSRRAISTTLLISKGIF